MIVGAGYALLGKPLGLIGYLRGERLIVAPALANLGTCALGESREVEVDVQNTGSVPVRIVGGTSTCTCVATKGLPIVVPANSSRRVLVEVHVRGRHSHFSQIVTLFTDLESQGQLSISVVAAIDLGTDPDGSTTKSIDTGKSVSPRLASAG